MSSEQDVVLNVLPLLLCPPDDLVFALFLVGAPKGLGRVATELAEEAAMHP